MAVLKIIQACREITGAAVVSTDKKWTLHFAPKIIFNVLSVLVQTLKQRLTESCWLSCCSVSLSSKWVSRLSIPSVRWSLGPSIADPRDGRATWKVKAVTGVITINTCHVLIAYFDNVAMVHFSEDSCSVWSYCVGSNCPGPWFLVHGKQSSGTIAFLVLFWDHY